MGTPFKVKIEGMFPGNWLLFENAINLFHLRLRQAWAFADEIESN